MLIRTDCIPCILRMTVSALRKLFSDEAGAKPIFSEILEIPALRGRCWDMTSPEVLEHVMNRIIPAVNDPDPFSSIGVHVSEVSNRSPPPKKLRCSQ